jgi:hypothetical protein
MRNLTKSVISLHCHLLKHQQRGAKMKMTKQKAKVGGGMGRKHEKKGIKKCQEEDKLHINLRSVLSQRLVTPKGVVTE